MKRTLDIPDAVFQEAKAEAAKQGISLRQFVTEAVAEKLKPTSEAKPWTQVVGGCVISRRRTRESIGSSRRNLVRSARRLVSPQRTRLASPGTPPIVGASFTARTIACATASAPATPSVSTFASSFPSDSAITISPSDIVFTG